MSKPEEPNVVDHGWSDSEYPPEHPLSRALSHHAPPVPAARDEFREGLRSRFVGGVASGVSEPSAARGQDGRLHWSRLIAWPAVAVAAAVVLLVLAPRDAAAPPPISRGELLQKNTAAWIELEDVKGRYEDGSGRTYEEWVRFEEGSLPMYRRLTIGASEVPGVLRQWNISNGQTEWIVDGTDGRVVESVPVDESLASGAGLSVPTTLQCANLELPNAVGGPPPEAGVRSGVPVYRLEVLAEGRTHLYVVDARDMLVRWIEDDAGDVIWARDELAINTGLSPEEFTPTNLDRLHDL